MGLEPSFAEPTDGQAELRRRKDEGEVRGFGGTWRVYCESVTTEQFESCGGEKVPSMW